MYAKNENGTLVFPPQNKDNILNYNQNSAQLEQDGYIDYSARQGYENIQRKKMFCKI